MSEQWTPTTDQVRSFYAHDSEDEYHDPIAYPSHVRSAEQAFDRWLAAHDREVAAKALRGFVEQLQTSESGLALKLDDILNGIDWMDSGDEVARWIISAITATGEIRATQIEKGTDQ